VTETSFDAWFAKLAGSAVAPRAWQRSLASAQIVRNQLIRIPTGMGRMFASSPHGLGNDCTASCLLTC